ncbi:MAG: hypothetical protein GY749_39435 [Desulfobacteraceae bacterium]|nr:hypothetical protein [Desulfobacteraceae bacterium]
MKAHSKRAYPRINYEAPIKYAHYNKGRFSDSRMFNSSEGGLYFELGHALEPESKIYIVMVNYSPSKYGAEAYRFYTALIRWCKEVSYEDSVRFGVGVQFIEKRHEVSEPNLYGLFRACDLCECMVPEYEIHMRDDYVSLCPHCFKHMEAFPEGIIKDNIERFLIGNVI